VVGVAEQKLQLVPAERERHRRLGLAGAEVQVLEVVRDRLIERRQFGIDDEMMVPGVGIGQPRRRDTHVDQSEMDRDVRRNLVAVLHADEIHPRVRRAAVRCTGSATRTLILSENSGGLCGMWSLSPNRSWSVCSPAAA
jgi:hypothetical protein